MPKFNPDSTALVIAAGGGIGLAMTRKLLSDPRFMRVIATSRNIEQACELQALAQDHTGLELFSLDATVPATLEALAVELKSRDIRPALVIYCAGLLHETPSIQPEKRLEDLDLTSIERVFAVNAFGPAMMFKHFLPLVPRQEASVMAVVSARVGSIGDNRLGGWYAYRASKSALNQFMKTAAIEARRRFKHCILTCVHPGTTDTALSRPFQANVPEGKLFQPEFVADRFMEIFEQLEPDDSGAFLAWDGQLIPW